ncbi:MAG: Hsp70 family protein [SAR324 cluster bacterium]|uniref:Hsp70 family protein n=1 Tax=SAR324 cluster bacterium TaxID=2024889 RepID=A0A7X9IKJ1_9DELT|nr:Hsp70 family protein [SAR324 cluster bacterium]
MQTFFVGIDLGTSNAVMALCGTAGSQIEVLQIPQLSSLQSFSSLDKLPTVVYLPTEQEKESIASEFPWGSSRDFIVGVYAKERGAEIPDRVVVSAKSWLGFHHVNPDEAVLPWESEIPEGKISAFDATRLYLEHLREALTTDPRVKGEFNNLEITLTVPASFDEMARTLTLNAARAAGFESVSLIEEPLAAFYNWLELHSEDWREKLRLGDIVLVCDVGGGTADFTLIRVEEERGELLLRRINVGEHVLLGGDNMDLALALSLKRKFETNGPKLDNWQFISLIHAARRAKERLFSDHGIDEIPISIVSKGASIFAGSRSTVLNRSELIEVVIDRFIPLDSITEFPKEDARSGLLEYGLPYAKDSALSHHLAAFLSKSVAIMGGDLSRDRILEASMNHVMPNLVLFNGGVFNAEPLRARVLQLLRFWNNGNEVAELPSADYDLAVARGAAAFARIRSTGQGVRVKAGLPRSYYIGLERASMSAPGYVPPLKAVCVAVQGMEEGTSAELSNKEFSLLAGQEVGFRLFSAQGMQNEAVGRVVEDAEERFQTALDMHVCVKLKEGDQRKIVPVRLRSYLSNIGLLEVWMEERGGEGRWKLEVDTRG